jgi:hypothetical protein
LFDIHAMESILSVMFPYTIPHIRAFFNTFL